MVDTFLIQQSISGNRASQGQLYNSTAPYVFAIIKNYIVDETMRKDLLQECFVKIFTHLNQFDTQRGLWKSWVSKITVNQCLQHLQKSNKLNLSFGLEIVEPIQSWDPNLLDDLSTKDIEEMLQKMPLGYRTVFMLSVVEGYDHAEIADCLSISQETSRSQLSRSISWIRKNINFDLSKRKYGIEF
jgi:RNA polymerase sigma factor (sigma-70 family)